jgi:16S rRNA (cytosine967-C5)-methyltransferase
VEGTLQRLRLHAPNLQLVTADATDTARFAQGRRFDAILLDAPCSATGIIRRQPDIKWHRRAEDIAALVALQARLLDALWPLLAPGGRLLYATCSLLKDENARQVDAFLARTANAQALPLEPRFGRASGAGRQRLPGEQGMDGFYYALLGRRDG